MRIEKEPLEMKQFPALYRIRVGDILVTAVSDGYIKGGEGILRNVDADAANVVLRASHRYPSIVDVNAFVIERAGRAMLIDTGSGAYMGRNAGLLAANLHAASISIADIDTIFLTHIHPDHVGGLSDKGTRRFPNAELVVNAAEYSYWMDEEALKHVKESQRALFFERPREQLAPYLDRLRLFTGGEVFPGVTVLPMPGHTPGHSICLVSSGPDTLLIWGDTVHVPEVQTAFPDAGVVFDVDPPNAAKSRRRVFDMVTAERIPVMGMHLGFPGLIQLEPHGEGYKPLSLPWRHTL